MISLTAPKPLVKWFQGRHFVGGRFVSQEIADKYGFDVPPYKGCEQIVEVGSHGEKLSKELFCHEMRADKNGSGSAKSALKPRVPVLKVISEQQAEHLSPHFKRAMLSNSNAPLSNCQVTLKDEYRSMRRVRNCRMRHRLVHAVHACCCRPLRHSSAYTMLIPRSLLRQSSASGVLTVVRYKGDKGLLLVAMVKYLAPVRLSRQGRSLIVQYLCFSPPLTCIDQCYQATIVRWVAASHWEGNNDRDRNNHQHTLRDSDGKCDKRYCWPARRESSSDLVRGPEEVRLRRSGMVLSNVTPHRTASVENLHQRVRNLSAVGERAVWDQGELYRATRLIQSSHHKTGLHCCHVEK
ncbi:hypothetical protein KC338_g68 [Hortaea werneckii]|nr:hypothetical protein KC338_g68 [Hortaea werneckii]